MKAKLIIPPGLEPIRVVLDKADDFIAIFETYEISHGSPLVLLYDAKSEAYYFICHINAQLIVEKTDLDAVLDPQESEDYKLNRNIYTDAYAYKSMEADAKKGRSFEDIVVEYDDSYREDKPLKVFGGQHRVRAIGAALRKGIAEYHGIRVYINLSTEQKFDIATANNTSIAVSNDLLDRMQEDLLGKELREWCQAVGLLSKGHNFADKRSSEGTPTVRIARTLIVNFFHGKSAPKDSFHQPIVCSSGKGIDKDYEKIRSTIDWNDEAFKTMGEQFAKLHKTQREKVLGRETDRYLEYAIKAIHPTVAASWAYAAGLFQRDPDALKAHYALSDGGGPKDDPLNAKDLSKARFKPTDPDTYRGLGARISNEELGRMFSVFLLQATKASKPGINLKLANAAIQTYQAVKTKYEAEKALKGI